MRSLIAPIRIRSVEHGRKVTWLELFFDLVFVAAVSQVAAPLHDDYTLHGLLRLTPLFVLIWCAWTGHSVFATRFDTDDAAQRGLTLLQMFAVTIMAANARDALDSRSSAGFAAAYGVMRLILVAQYARARAVPRARGLATRYLTGHGCAALMWLGSALVPPPVRFIIWIGAFALDLGTPWLLVEHSVALPPDPSHLPERFGLFTLILLGESVVALMRGVESQEYWPVEAATSALLGMCLLFVLWWWYFDGIGAAEAQPVHSRRDAMRFHLWSYAHFPLSLAIVVLGVGIERSVTAAAQRPLDDADVTLIADAAAVVVAAMAVIAGARRHRPSASRPLQATWAAAIVILVSPLLVPPSPAFVIGFLVLIYSALLLRWVWQPARNEQTGRRAVVHQA
ncbi:MAG: low temperature requirement protein A [Blastocatellia bacterium]|nr:MAG: low temperature requirement protein A [Blastocatellia bacterium]